MVALSGSGGRIWYAAVFHLGVCSRPSGSSHYAGTDATALLPAARMLLVRAAYHLTAAAARCLPFTCVLPCLYPYHHIPAQPPSPLPRVALLPRRVAAAPATGVLRWRLQMLPPLRAERHAGGCGDAWFGRVR